MKYQQILLGFCLLLPVKSFAQNADAIFLNGNICTTFLSPDLSLSPTSGGVWDERPPVQIFKPSGMGPPCPFRDSALATKDGKILTVGSDDQIKKSRGPNTKVFNLHGRFVMPGFSDAHAHLANGGFEELDANLNGTTSLAEMQQRIAERAKTAAVGEWIVGRGWDHTLWASQTLPARQDLDAVTADHPAIFTRVDGHISVATSAALKFAGITRASADPAGGKIDRDAAGEPTGILRETAKDELLDKLPKPTPAQRRRALELALADAAQSGVTSVQDYSDWEDFLTFEELEREGKLTARISEWLPFDTPLGVLEQHRAHHPQSDPMLHTGMLKAFMDGSLGSRTAALLQPYSDDPNNSGLPQYA